MQGEGFIPLFFSNIHILFFLTAIVGTRRIYRVEIICPVNIDHILDRAEIC